MATMKLPWVWRPATEQEIRSERLQAQVRFPIVLLMSIYVVVASLVVSPVREIEPWAANVLSAYTAYSVAAIAILAIVNRFPGHYPLRRVTGMLCDLAAASYGIIAGCTVMLPSYVFIVWVVLGNGMRFGPRYLIVASGLGQIALGIIFVATPHWQTDPVMAVTLCVTAVVVPAFAYSLLRAKERSDRAVQELVAQRSRFIAQASHDMRQPVHAMQLFVSGLKRTPLRPEQEQLVERLDRSIEGIAALFGSLLDIASLDGGTIRPALVAMPVQRLFAELEEQFSGTPGLRFVPTRRWIRADPALTRTLVQNLVSNAVKHAPGARVVIGCRRRAGRLSIVVADSGPGIGAEHLSRLFDEFYQVRRSTGQTTGVGLGLAIVRRLAAMLGVNAELRSVPGRGTIAAVHGFEDVAERDQPDEARPGPASIGSPLKGMRILLVDDDEAILHTTADLLRSWGCTVEASTSLPAKPHPCDLIVTDYDLGRGLSGLDVVRIGRAVSGRPVPAIIVTGHELSASQMIPEADRQMLLRKPVRPAELRSAISTIRADA